MREIKDRLQGRLEESELAILEKDKELTQRSENELWLRHTLELKERELVSLGVTIETSSSDKGERNEKLTRKNEHGDGGDLCELRSSMDQQMSNIKQRLEPHHDDHVVYEVPSHNGNHDMRKIEEMGSDIDILKQTMDLAFGKMQSALFLCEMRPKERQWKLTIEKDIITILIRSFMREFQENVEAEVRRGKNQVCEYWREHWSQLINEITSLRDELSTEHDTCLEDSDCSSFSSPTKASTEDGSHEMLNTSLQAAGERDKEGKLQEEEENENGSNFVAKMIKSHESIIRQKSEELNLSKHRILQEKRVSSKTRKELNNLKERIHVVTERLDSLIHWNIKLGESIFNQKAIHEKETLPRKKLSEVYEIDRVSKNVNAWRIMEEKVKEVSNVGNKVQEEMREYNTMQNLTSKDMYRSIDGVVEEFDCKSYNFYLEKLIEEHVYKYCLREVINEWNEGIEKDTIERKIRDDINLILFSKAVKDISSINQEFVLVKCQSDEAKIESTIKEEICMLIFKNTVDEFDKIMVGREAVNIIREQIDQIVFVETLTNVVNTESSASIEHKENTTQDNLLDQLQFVTIESLLKEDVCMVVFKAMLKEWKLELESYYMENIIRENIHHVIMVETLNDAFLLFMELKSQVKFNNTIQDNCSTMILNQVQKVHGEGNLIVILLESLLSCFEAEENLMLSARCEIKEHSKQLDLGSERGDLHEHEIFEDLLTGEEQTFSSLTSKVENVLQQLGTSKALLRELGTNLGHGLRGSECNFHSQILPTNEEWQLVLSSFESSTFAEFEAMVYQKFEIMTMR